MSLPEQGAAVREFVREFALSDSPGIPHHEGLAYVRGYSAAIKHLVAAAGLDLEEMKAAAYALADAKLAARQS